MNWPWSRRKFKDGLRRCDATDVRATVKRLWPNSNLAIECGDFEYYMPNRMVSEWLWENVPQILHGYAKSAFDCENFTRKRMVQMDDLLQYWTDLDLPLAVFEVRGYTQDNRGPDRPGHSMLLELTGDVGSRLREPYAGFTIKDTKYIEEPWLVYQ